MNRLAAIFTQVMTVFKAYKVRTVIAVVGVLLGAMALVVVQNIASSLHKKIQKEINDFGDRVVTVYSGAVYVPGKIKRSKVVSMKMQDMAVISGIENITAVTGTVRGLLPVRYTSNTVNSVVIGTGEEYFSLRGLNLSEGRFFYAQDRKENGKVAVIGSDVYDKLYKNSSPLDTVIYINNAPFNVIGVLKEKGIDVSGKSLDNIVLIPMETAMVRVFNRTYLNEILFKMRSWDDFYTVSKNVEAVLRFQHKLSDDTENDFFIVNPSDEAKLDSTLIGLARLLGTVSAAIAFIIGTVGIFSLMLLIVSQRTVEVGIKRAIGATKREILIQFIMESGYIGLIGGVCGIVIGILLSLAVCAIASLPYTVSVLGALGSFFAALLSGTVAGIYPAVKASRVVPVKALNL